MVKTTNSEQSRSGPGLADINRMKQLFATAISDRPTSDTKLRSPEDYGKAIRKIDVWMTLSKLQHEASLEETIKFVRNEIIEPFPAHIFPIDYGALKDYAIFSESLVRFQIPIINASLKHPFLIEKFRKTFPRNFEILATFLREGCTHLEKALPRLFLGGLEHLPKQILILDELDALRLSDSMQVYGAILENRTYYVDANIFFGHLWDTPDQRGEFVVAVKDNLDLWSYDRWTENHVPIASLKALRKAVHQAQGLRTRRHAVLTHPESIRLAQWLGLEIRGGKAFLGGLTKAQGFRK